MGIVGSLLPQLKGKLLPLAVPGQVPNESCRIIQIPNCDNMEDGTQLLLAVPARWQVLGRRQRPFSKLSWCCCSQEHELLHWMMLYYPPQFCLPSVSDSNAHPQHGSSPVTYQGLLNLDCSPGSSSLLGACPPMQSSL